MARPPTLMKMRGAVSRSSPTAMTSGASKLGMAADHRAAGHRAQPALDAVARLADQRVGAGAHASHVDVDRPGDARRIRRRGARGAPRRRWRPASWSACSPVFTQVPPNRCRSISATVMPAAVRRPASGGPAWPAPTMMASNRFMKEPGCGRHAAGAIGCTRKIAHVTDGAIWIRARRPREGLRRATATSTCPFAMRAAQGTR